MNVLQSYSRELIAANNDSSEAPDTVRVPRRTNTETRKTARQEVPQTDQLSHWLDRVMHRTA
ncbi:MAG: hypothetical protein AAFY69_12410 [Pseudomonadota bacterium]